MRSSKTGKLNIWIQGMLMICLVMFMTGLLCCAKSFAAGVQADVKVPWSQLYTAGGNHTNDTFTYRIEPVGGAPVPQGSNGSAYDFSIKGEPGTVPSEGQLDLSFTFPGKGVYKYNVSAYVPSPEKGFTYDKSVYTLKIYILESPNGGLSDPQLIIQDSSGNKLESLSFKVSHEAETLPPEDIRPTTTPTGGDTVPEEGVPVTPKGSTPRTKTPRTTSPRSTADNTPAPAATDQPAPAAADEPAPEKKAAPEKSAPQSGETPTDQLGDDDVPRSFWERSNWALLNLIFAILTLLIAFELLRRFFERIDTEDDEYIVRREGSLRLGGIIPAAAAIVLEAVTQNFREQMVLVDARTPVMALILLVEIGVAAAVYVRYDRYDE